MPSADPLIETDKAFNAMAQQDGMAKAFIAYADKDVILLRQGNQLPLYGKDALARDFADVKGSPLSWEPLKAEIAASGDLGYTYGRYRVKSGETVKTGVYVSIWKKQADGAWKYVLDGGAPTSEEAQKP